MRTKRTTITTIAIPTQKELLSQREIVFIDLMSSEAKRRKLRESRKRKMGGGRILTQRRREADDEEELFRLISQISVLNSTRKDRKGSEHLVDAFTG